MSDRLVDPGLQPERTELAWRRTALALAVGSLVAMRMLPAALEDPLWIVPGVLGLVVTGIMWMGARARYARYRRAIESEHPGDLPGAGLPLFLALFAAGIGLLALVAFGVAVMLPA